MMTARMRNVLDSSLNKLLSRKLLVFILATFFLCLGIITPDLWVGVASTYIGVEGIKDGLTAWHSAKADAATKITGIAQTVLNPVLEGKDNNA